MSECLAFKAPSPRVDFDGKKSLHHIRQLHGRLFGHGSLHQIEYSQPCHVIYRIATRNFGKHAYCR